MAPTDVRPTEQAREFIRGLLAYLGFEEALTLAATDDGVA